MIGLVSNDDGSAFEIVRALEDVGIHAIDARPLRARRSNLTAVADLALEVAIHGSPRADVALLLRSAYVEARPANRTTLLQVAEALEQTVTREGEDSAHRLAATVLASSARGRRDVRALGDTALSVGRALAVVASGRTRREHSLRARALFRELGLERAGQASTDLSTDHVSGRRLDLEARARDHEAWTALSATLASYDEAMATLGLADEAATLEAFRHELAWIDARRPRPSVHAPGAVRLVPFAELSGEESALVVIADADAAAWPDGRMHAELVPPLLADRLKDASDPAFLPLAHAGPSEVLARLALGTQRARRVVFTYSARGPEGDVRGAAPIVARVSREGDANTVTTWRASAAVARPLSEHEWDLAELAREPSLAQDRLPDVARRAQLEKHRDAAFGVALHESHPLASTLPTGAAFAAILTDETGGTQRPLSASAVDRLASCVFQGFVSEVLRPKRARKLHDVSDLRQAGETVHAVLDTAFRATAGLWSTRPRDGERILRVGLEAAERELEGQGTASALGRTLKEQALAGVRAMLAWSIADEAWDFSYGEQSFGEAEREGAWDTLVLERGGVRVELRGRIDRVDVSHLTGAVRVIDYKPKESSATTHTAAFGTTKFQLALYARAAEQALGHAKSEGLYLPTQRLRPFAAPKKHAEQWAFAHETIDGVARFEKRVLELVTAVREGRIGVRPHAPTSCEHCDFDGVCRKPRFAVTMPSSDGGDEDDS